MRTQNAPYTIHHETGIESQMKILMQVIVLPGDGSAVPYVTFVSINYSYYIKQ